MQLPLENWIQPTKQSDVLDPYILGDLKSQYRTTEWFAAQYRVSQNKVRNILQGLANRGLVKLVRYSGGSHWQLKESNELATNPQRRTPNT